MPLWIQLPPPINWIEEYGKKVWDVMQTPPLVTCNSQEEFWEGIRLVGQMISLSKYIREGKYHTDDEGNLYIEE